MEVPYARAQVTIRCGLHNCPVEFYANEYALSVLDRLQLGCPGMGEELMRLHMQRHQLEAEASKASLDAWKADHPEETKLYPADYVPTLATEYWPQEYKDAVDALDRREEELADKDLESWTVVLEEIP